MLEKYNIFPQFVPLANPLFTLLPLVFYLEPLAMSMQHPCHSSYCHHCLFVIVTLLKKNYASPHCPPQHPQVILPCVSCCHSSNANGVHPNNLKYLVWCNDVLLKNLTNLVSMSCCGILLHNINSFLHYY